jgi:hypothetical protein
MKFAGMSKLKRKQEASRPSKNDRRKIKQKDNEGQKNFIHLNYAK